MHWSGVVIKCGSTKWCSLQSLLYSADQFTRYYHPLNLRRAFIYLQLTVTTLVKQLFSRTTWVSRYQNVSILDFIGVKADRDGGDSWSYKTRRSSSHIVTTNKPTPSLLQAGCPSCHPTNNVRTLNGKLSHSMDLFTPSSCDSLPTFSLTSECTRLPLAGLPSLLAAL